MKVLSSFRVKSAIQKELIEKFPTVTFSFQPSIEEADAELHEAEILLTYGENLNNEIINKAEKLKWIMVVSAGIDKMPLEAITEKGILVTNARGIHKTPMAEYTLSMMLQTARKTKQLMKNEQEELWERRIQTMELSGNTVTILGTGAIGSEIARLSKAFNMKTIGVNRSGKTVENFDEVFPVTQLEKTLEQGDYVVSVLPNTPETAYLIKPHHFKKMKNNSVFINIGRGNIVKEADLLKALEDQEIQHAVLDVFETEPLPKGHPFWKMENVTVTPHISGLSPLYQPRGFEIFEYNLRQYVSGKNHFKNIIDVNRGY